MVKNKKTLLFVLSMILIVSSLGLVFSSFQSGGISHSINSVYGPEFNITGWTNMSFSEEPADSKFLWVFYDENDEILRKNISLEKALGQNPSYSYSCIPETSGECKNDYFASNPQSSKSVVLEENQEIIYGLRILGDSFSEISQFSISASSNASSSQFPQLIIDILNDGSNDWLPYKSSGNFQGMKKGCFNSPETSKGVVTQSEYNNLIHLSPSPSLKIGAIVEKHAANPLANFTMQIKNPSTGEIGLCNIRNVTTDSGEVECIPITSGNNFSVKEEGDFLVSIWAENFQSKDQYRIKYKTNASCRGSDLANFELFVKPGTYTQMGNFNLNNSEIEKSIGINPGIENKITNYILDRYGGNCGSEGCIVPIKFSSNVNQTLQILSVDITYLRNGITEFLDRIHDIEETSPKITSNFQKIYLNNLGISVPAEIGNYNLSVSFGNSDLTESTEIFREEIEVKNAPIIESLNTLKTASAVPTQFTVFVNVPSETNITKYDWEFGDNKSSSTFVNSVNHTYDSTGEYLLRISVTDSRGLSSSKEFSINVTLPNEFIENRLLQLSQNINRIKSDTENLDIFHQQGINEILNLTFSESRLNEIQGKYNQAKNESEYNSLVKELLNINIPKSIVKTDEINEFFFIPEESKINVASVREVAGGEYDVVDEEKYQNAIAAWQQQNLDIKIDFEKFSQETGTGMNPLISFFSVNVDEKIPVGYPYYFIIPELENIGFDSNLRNEQGQYFKELRPKDEIKFYTSKETDFLDVPLIISPSLSKLSIISYDEGNGEGELGEISQKTKLLILAFALLIITGILAYVIMQEWYKRKYEKHLFKNRNDLYNIVNYVNNAKRKNMEKDRIEENLKKAGWGSEQVRYVIKKYAGKRTGMLEIPIDKIIKKFSRNK